MMELKKTCKGMDERLADLLLEPASVPAEVRDHVAKCEGCRTELKELQAAMGVMDAWAAPEPSPYFLTRLNARMREEREQAAGGWLARLKAGLASNARRPLAAMALTVLLLVGGGAYLSVSNLLVPAAPQPNEAAVVHDLQTLENNAQVLDTLENLAGGSDSNGY